MLKKDKSLGVDSSPAEILNHAAQHAIDVLIVLYEKLWTSGGKWSMVQELDTVTDYSSSEQEALQLVGVSTTRSP